MMRSSESNPGSRKIIIDKIKYLTNSAAVVDARYEIQNADGSIRKMWSTFIVVSENAPLENLCYKEYVAGRKQAGLNIPRSG